MSYYNKQEPRHCDVMLFIGYLMFVKIYTIFIVFVEHYYLKYYINSNNKEHAPLYLLCFYFQLNEDMA